ncbi:TolC family protein [uncultured Helicobacter sp.]|uniref:TolC family protein n=1 Tax=uncultured Helicobacter sp. TaxID=175537 RepID=UPI001C3BBEAC|nr:TolC family protein [Candidatus Helicobacter avicola]
MHFRIVSVLASLAFVSQNLVCAPIQQNPESLGKTLSILSNVNNNDERGYTLTELLEAAKNNYNLEAKDIAILQAKANQAAARREFLPTLDGSYSFQDTDNTYRTMQTQNAQLQAKWELFSGLKTYNKVREKSSLYRSSIADRANTQEQIFLNVIEQYYTYFSNKSQKVALEQQHKQLEENIKRTEKLYRSGLTTIDDVESLRAEILSTEHDMANIVLEMERNKLMLSLLTNLEVKELSRVTIKMPTFTLQKRQDLIALEEQANSVVYQAKQITYLPTIALSDTFAWNYFDTGSYRSKPAMNDLFASMGGGSTSSFYGSPVMMQMSYPRTQNVIGVSVNMRLFDWFNLSKQKEAVRYLAMQRQKELAYKKYEQEKDERLYRKSIEIAEARIKSAEAALKSASVSFDNVARRYEAQVLNFSDYLQSLSRRFSAESTYTQSLNDYEIEKARYIYYSGQQIEDYIE